MTGCHLVIVAWKEAIVPCLFDVAPCSHQTCSAGSAGSGGSVDVSGSASAVQDTITPAIAQALATALATCA